MRGALTDLDGVIWEADRAVDGAPETLTWIRDTTNACRVLGNDTTRIS